MPSEGEARPQVFGVFDFFAYIGPAVLLLTPFVVFPLLSGALVPPDVGRQLEMLTRAIMESPHLAVVWMVVLAPLTYLLGLIIHLLGRSIEDALLLERRQAAGKGAKVSPSGWVLASAESPLSTEMAVEIRRAAQRIFRLKTADDGLLWGLAYRYLFIRGRLARVQQFLSLHTLARGTMTVSLVWVAICLVLPVAAPTTTTTATMIAIVAFPSGLASFYLRRRFNIAVATEVFLTFFVETSLETSSQGRSASIGNSEP